MLYTRNLCNIVYKLYIHFKKAVLYSSYLDKSNHFQ